MLIGKQISGLLLLFSSKRVCCHCGARHNDDMDLYGTVYRSSSFLISGHCSIISDSMLSMSETIF